MTPSAAQLRIAEQGTRSAGVPMDVDVIIPGRRLIVIDPAAQPNGSCPPVPPVAKTDAIEKKASLLLVDDEELNLDMLSRRLERSGFSVQLASSGRDALRLVSEQSFDLVLLDQMMPGMSGSEVLSALRAEASADVLPVIMVTAVAESDKISEALENGANDYITKPVDFKVAVARIQAQLARKRADTALRHSEERYALAARASRDGLWDWNLTTGLIYFSPRWKQMLGLGEAVAQDAEAWFSRIIPTDRQATSDAIRVYLAGPEDVLQCSYRMRHSDGTLRWMSCRGIATRDADGVPVRLAGSQSDITEEKTRDVLTGLPNRLLLISQLECAIENRSVRREAPSKAAAESYAILFLDLDGFKTINDSLGHVAGDYLLKGIAARLRVAAAARFLESSENPAPLIARMGGDEFAILLEGNTARSSVEAFARDVQRLMKESFDLRGHPVHCVFSIGVALSSDSHGTPEDVLREADIAMYTAKLENRGEIVIFDQRMRDAATEHLELESDIRSAVEHGELIVLYQPKVDLATGLTYGVEALVRWNHPKRGLLQPLTFINIAEQTGVIVEIGRWVLREACRQVQAWHLEFPLVPPLELSVNISPREFKQKQLVEEIKRTLAETGFPPQALHLEITEGVLFEDMASARAILYALKEIGLRLDIDDFGTGFSSLKYLSELPFDSLKIDQYFTAGLDPAQPSSGELIQTIVNMAANLGLQVVAEGIETEAHSSTLRMLGCRFGQGYYYSRPIAPEALRELLALQRRPSASEQTLLLPSTTAAEPSLQEQP